MIDKKVIKDFGNEWSVYDQQELNKNEQKNIFNDYFSIFPFDELNKNSVGADFGCGSGRWSELLYNKFKLIYCLEPSKAIEVAKLKLNNANNIIFLNETIKDCSIKDTSLDFAISLGVLHHVEDTEHCLSVICSKLKYDSPFLIYLYSNLENKSFLYKLIWKISDYLRKVISILPFRLKLITCYLISLFIYFPLSFVSRILHKLNFSTKNIPLNYYKDKSFYTMRTDTLDRFGTKIEKRFSKNQINKLLINAGFKNINFSNKMPYWCVCCYKK
jgi:SAM-dependent methyltransferase